MGSGKPGPLNEPFLPSLDPILLDFNNKPSSPTHALNLLKICQTPNLSTIQPPTLSPTHSSPSVDSSIQHFNALDTGVQTPPHRNSLSSPFNRIEEALNTIKADFQDFKQDNAKTTETLRDHAITLTTYGTSLASLLETQNKQQLEITQLQNSNSCLTQDLLNQTHRITQLEKTVEALTISTDDLTSKNLALQSTLNDIETLKTQMASQNELIDALNSEPPANSTKIIQKQVQAHL